MNKVTNLHVASSARSALVVTALSAVMTLAHGAVAPVAIPIANAGFESNAAANGFVVLGTPASWTVYNPQNINGSSDAIGVINPTGTQHFPAGAKEGRNAAVIFMGGPATGPAGLEQIIPGSIQGNRRYTLQVEVGNIASGSANFGYFNLAGFPGYRIELLAGSIVLASDENSLGGLIPEGEFRTSTIVASVPPSHPAALFGYSLQVRLVNLNRSGTAAEPGIEVNFDHVRLTMEALQPELSIAFANDRSLAISWRDLAGRFRLQTLTDLGSGAWENVTPLPTRNGDVNEVRQPGTVGAAYFRLVEGL